MYPVWETFFSRISPFWLVALKLYLPKLIAAKSDPDSKITIFLHLPFYHVHPNPILFDINKFYSTESVFKIIWIVCIELWEIHINFIWSRFGIRRHLLAFSIIKRNQYGRWESLTEKLLRQVGWQGRVQNNRNSPRDVQLPDCAVLKQTYSPNLFSSGFWRVVVSFTVCTLH